MKKNQYKITLEPLSPLHIGNGEKLTSVGEFITTSDTIRYLNLNEINLYLEKENLIDDYTSKILNAGTEFDIVKSLSGYNIEIEKYIAHEIKLTCKNLNPLNNNLLYLFHNENGEKYIPGSSIKGMIKTALLFHFLKQDDSYIQKLENFIITEISNAKRKEFKRRLKNVWEIVLKKNNIFYSPEFNNLRIQDSEPIKNENLQVEQVRRQHLFGVESESLDWLEETVKSNSLIDLEMTIVPEFGESFDILNQSDIKQLFFVLNSYSLQMIDFEIKLMKKSVYEHKRNLIDFLIKLKTEISNSNNEFAVCRLGKGKTIYFQTILSLLNTEVLEIVIEKFRKENSESTYFPATRVLTAFDEMPGWIKIVCNNSKLFDISSTPDSKNKSDEEFELCQNNLDEIIEKKSIITANFLSLKRVSFILNGIKYENVQLINPLKRNFKTNEPIKVIIWLMNSKGVQHVKIEEK